MRFRREYTSATLCPLCVEEYNNDEDNVPIDQFDDDSDEIMYLKLFAWQCFCCYHRGSPRTTTDCAFDDMM